MSKSTTMQWALGFSLGVHLLLITTRFVAPDAFNRVFEDTPLEVILVNARSKEPPSKVQALAQARLAGGGSAEEGRAMSALPPSSKLEYGDSLETTRRQIERLQENQQQLLAQLRRDVALMPPPDPQRNKSDPKGRAQEEKRRQLINQLAEIEKRVNLENARPKKRYISPATQEVPYALYYDRYRRKIEEQGTRNFPEFQGKKLYGELIMNVTVDARGHVVDTEILRPSRSKQLDRRAVAIVKAAAPFGAFTRDMVRVDQVVFTARFRFTRDEGLETTMLASPSPP
jgi:protein TonB